MIVKVKGGWVVVSHTGKRLSRVYEDKDEAKKRLREIDYFKNRGKR